MGRKVDARATFRVSPSGDAHGKRSVGGMTTAAGRSSVQRPSPHPPQVDMLTEDEDVSVFTYRYE